MTYAQIIQHPTYSTHTCSAMFAATLSLVARKWKQGLNCKHPSIDEWVMEVWSIYTMVFYSILKKNEILKFAVEWIELEHMILSGVTQTQKDKHYMFFFSHF